MAKSTLLLGFGGREYFLIQDKKLELKTNTNLG